jgi:PAS domain S-box-containing protein
MMNFKKLQYISILLIENNKNLSNKIIGSFENIFENIYIAKDADEALKIYKVNKDNIDIVFVDIEQERDVYAIETIREVGQNIPVLAFVHPNEVSLLMQLFDYEVHTFLLKPINTYKLLRKINKLAEMIIYKNELKAKEKIIDENLIYSETDTRGIITYVSKPFIEISGYTKEELVGKSHNIIRHQDVEVSVFKDLWKTIKSGKPWSGEIKNLKKDGGHYTVKSVVSPIYNKNKIIGFGSARLDITQLKENSKQLHFHSKYKAMNEMLSMVSHHWRQPIASIGLEADNALFDIIMDESDMDSVINSLTHINEQVKYLSGTLDTFKGFLEKSSKQITLVDTLLKNVLFVVEGLLQEHNITLNISNFLENRAVFTYQNELINVLVNIIINAKENIIKNSIENGCIVISTKEVNDNTLEIKILDNGGGIDSKIIENIFEPYNSTKSAKNGTGLGLYIAKELVEKKLSGSIYANNVQNGAEFTLNIKGVVNG